MNFKVISAALLLNILFAACEARTHSERVKANIEDAGYGTGPGMGKAGETIKEAGY